MCSNAPAIEKKAVVAPVATISASYEISAPSDSSTDALVEANARDPSSAYHYIRLT